MKDQDRNQALKIRPRVCAKCGREFIGKKLSELTGHHKDHNYRNNPPMAAKGNCSVFYCHDNEHSP